MALVFSVILRSASVVPDMMYSKVSDVASKAETAETFLSRSSGSVAKQLPAVTGILNTQLEVPGLGGSYGQSLYLSVYLNIVYGTVAKVAAVYG